MNVRVLWVDHLLLEEGGGTQGIENLKMGAVTDGEWGLKYSQPREKPQKGEVGIFKKSFFLLLGGLGYWICL